MKLWIVTHRETTEDGDYREDHCIHHDMLKLLNELERAMVANERKGIRSAMLMAIAREPEAEHWLVQSRNLLITLRAFNTGDFLWFGDLTR